MLSARILIDYACMKYRVDVGCSSIQSKLDETVHSASTAYLFKIPNKATAILFRSFRKVIFFWQSEMNWLTNKSNARGIFPKSNAFYGWDLSFSWYILCKQPRHFNCIWQKINTALSCWRKNKQNFDFSANRKYKKKLCLKPFLWREFHHSQGFLRCIW